MKTKILLAAVAGALVLPAPMASQADVMGGTDFTIYGRVVAGAHRIDHGVSGVSASWDLGATGKDGNLNQQSRLGIKADRDLGGMTVGFKLEQGFDGDSGPNNQRHRYVYIGSDFGTLTLGNQGSPYLMGANWAQEWYLGGSTLRTFRDEGLGYSYSNGPFSLGVVLTGNDDSAATGDSPAARTADLRMRAAGKTYDETIDRTIIGASYDFGIVKVGVGYDADNTESEYDYAAIGVSGSVDAFEYYVGYQQKDDATQNGQNDLNGWGVFLGYGITDADKVYVEYESQSDDLGVDDEFTNLVLGYSHDFGGSTRFIGEYSKRDNKTATLADPTNLALTVMVSF